MASAYKYEENLMNDVIISVFHKHRYIVGSELTNDLFDILEQFITEIYLQNNVTKVDIDKYLLFDIKQRGIEVKFVPKNFICASVPVSAVAANANENKQNRSKQSKCCFMLRLEWSG